MDPREVLNTTVAPSAPSPGPLRAALRSAWTGWLGGILTIVLLGFACVDAAPWWPAILPLLALAACLAVRAAEEWPRVGFPACTLGVGAWTVAAGLFRAGIGWSREWDALRVSGALPSDPGLGSSLGLGLSILLGGAFLGVLFLHGEAIWRSLSSVRLAVTTLAAVGILSVIGTMVVQRFGAGSLPEPEQKFVEKFMKGQGAIPVNARFMVSPPKVVLTGAEEEKIRLTGEAFGEGKARQMRLGLTQMHEKSEKALAIEKHVAARREHLLSLFEHLEFLGFTNVFRTWWFNSLLVLLSLQVLAVMVKRWPWGWPMSGWVMTHAGVLVTLAGCVISDGLLRDGSVGMSPGETATAFEEATLLQPDGEPSRTPFGFGVRMLGTDQSFYHELQIAFPAVTAGDDVLWTQEQLRAGRVLKLKDPGNGATYEVRILDAFERARVQSVMVPAKSVGREGGAPVLRLRYLLDEKAAGESHAGHAHAPGEHVVDQGYLFTDGFYSGRVPAYAVRYIVAGTEEEARGHLAGRSMEGMGKHGMLHVTAPGLDRPLTVKAEADASAEAVAPDGTLWKVTVRRYHPAYWVGREPRPEDEEAEAWPEKPALEVLVRRGTAKGDALDAGAAPGEMLVYADPDLQSQWESMVRNASGHGGEGAPAGMKAAMKWGSGPAGLCSYRYEFAPPVQTWIVEGPGIARTLVVHRPGKEPETADFSKPGATMPLGVQGLVLRLEEAIPDAVPDLRIEGLREETDEEYLASCLRTLETGAPPEPTMAVARLEVKEKDAAGERTRTEWLLAEKRGEFGGQRFHSTDGRLLIAMVETNNSMMFRSALEVVGRDGNPILEDGEPVRTVVKVNHPLHWGGYAFYQNNFIAAAGGRPAASVFRVKYDRGIPTIYTGFVILTLGTCMLLYVDPLLRKRRREAAERAAAAGAAPGGTTDA
ncbi:MAG: cytochrome c biogenesis protein ResB [Planctomycetes bacterium]|nr:cytochrome c biogenesis protein ResB [Planctomycetota bacterium]